MRSLATGSAIGAAVHLIFWLAVVNLDSNAMDFSCGEISCWVLFVSELPVSVAYVSGSALRVTLGSLFLGTLWWGVLAGGVALLAKKMRDRLSNVH
jgi:hypothetical protein